MSELRESLCIRHQCCFIGTPGDPQCDHAADFVIVDGNPPRDFLHTYACAVHFNDMLSDETKEVLWINNSLRVVHVVPQNDLIVHEDSKTCVCGPRVERVDGGEVVVHPSLDGREFKEPDYKGPPMPTENRNHK